MLQLLLLPKKAERVTTTTTNKAMLMMMPIPTEPSSTCRCCKKDAHGCCPATTTTRAAAAAAATPFPLGEASLSEDDDDSIQRQQQQPVPCLDEPNLYQLPLDLYPTYRPLPLLVRIAVWMLSSLVVVSASSTSRSRWWTRILSSMTIWTTRAGSADLLASGGGSLNESFSNVAQCFFRFVITHRRYLIGSIFKILFLGFGINMALQERFRPPSRISTRSLMEKYFLPSKLSRFENVPLQLKSRYPHQEEALLPIRNITMGVHWLEYHNPRYQGHVVQNEEKQKRTSTTKTTRRILHLNHGFGASSLSWLPALPVLVEQLNCHVGLAHDAPGFGFTNRRHIRQNSDDVDDDDNEYYSNKRSAKIGQALLVKASSTAPMNSTVQQSTNEHVVVLMGHSMGSLTTLRMALDLVKKENKQNSFNITKCHVVLVAPVFRTSKRRPISTRAATATRISKAAITAPSRSGGGGRSWLSVWRQRVGRLTVDRPAAYALRRLVSSQSSSSSSKKKNNDFWRRGLGQVWGDKTRLSDADILRFQWPSIGQGWENGLIQFSKAQFSSSSSVNDDGDARSILQQVLSTAHPRVTVDVIVGEKDPLVPVRSIDTYFGDFMTNSTDANNCVVRLRVMPGLGHDPFEEDVEAFVATVKDLLLSSSS